MDEQKFYDIPAFLQNSGADNLLVQKVGGLAGRGAIASRKNDRADATAAVDGLLALAEEIPEQYRAQFKQLVAVAQLDVEPSRKLPASVLAPSRKESMPPQPPPVQNNKK